MTSTMSDTKLSHLYRGACVQDAWLLADVDPRDLLDLAQGRLAGERRQRLVAAIAESPSLAAAYRMARASGEWAQAVAADLAGQCRPAGAVPVLPRRAARVAAFRRPLALAATVAAMAVGAVFVTQNLRAPESRIDAMVDLGGVKEDSIASASFDSGEGDHIFSFGTTSRQAHGDGIFGQGFGGGS